MKIKNILSLILLGALLAACDEVDKADRLIYMPLSEANRCVLVEDFTGQKCVNCPKATTTLQQLQEQYGEEQVIAVALHGGSFGISESNSKTIGLATAEADAYYSHWNIQAQPSGVINRVGGIKNFESWTTAVSEQIQRTTPVKFTSLTASFNADSTKITVDTHLLAGEEITGKLQLWLLEDGIIAPQYLPDGSAQMDYTHNHVFRKSINGTWGTPITLSEQEASLQNEVTMDSRYNPNNLSVVAFYYTDAEGVYQACKTRVK